MEGEGGEEKKLSKDCVTRKTDAHDFPPPPRPQVGEESFNKFHGLLVHGTRKKLAMNL